MQEVRINYATTSTKTSVARVMAGLCFSVPVMRTVVRMPGSVIRIRMVVARIRMRIVRFSCAIRKMPPPKGGIFLSANF